MAIILLLLIMAFIVVLFLCAGIANVVNSAASSNEEDKKGLGARAGCLITAILIGIFMFGSFGGFEIFNASPGLGWGVAGFIVVLTFIFIVSSKSN